MQPAFDDMSPLERIRHVQALWDRIADAPDDVPVSAAMKAELDRRVADHDARPDDVTPWDEVKASLRQPK